MRTNVACILLAAGLGTRFGGNKLLARVDGTPMIVRACRQHAAQPYALRVLVARPGDGELLAQALRFAFRPAYNPNPRRGIASSLCIGLNMALSAAEGEGLGLDGALFGVCDQPGLRGVTVARLLEAFDADPSRIVAPVSPEGRRGNPVIFPRASFPELLELRGDRGGGVVIERHPKLLLTVPAPAEELRDVDTAQDASSAETELRP